MWTHRPLRDHLGSGVGTNKSDPLRPRDPRQSSSSNIPVSPSLLASRHRGSSTLHLSLFGFGSLSCHIHNTQGNILTDLQEHKYEIVGQQVSRPSLVRHPISPTVCWTNIWRMEQVIKRIAFPSCFVTSLCHLNFSSRLYRLDTANERNSLLSKVAPIQHNTMNKCE